MAKKVKEATATTSKIKRDRYISRYFIAFPVIAFIIKMITVSNTVGGGWLGADGENYFKGVDGLYAEGIFSKAEILNYWPAGYPILLWLLILISTSQFVYLISIIQSVLFAYSTYFLAKNIFKTNVSWLAFPVALFISFNPTLSLSSLAVGYETPVASCFMMALGIIISNKVRDDKSPIKSAAFAGAWLALAAFMQPRYILAGLFIFFIWGLSITTRSLKIKVISVSVLVMMLSPLSLITRNIVAIDQTAISTNLGVTMAIGAGDETDGSYARTGPAIPCEPKTEGAAVSDNQLVNCVLKWYLTNPIKTLELTFDKSQYFWSPWSGPLANGTMRRNPSLKVSPTQNIIETQAGANFVAGKFGKTISYLWIISQIGLLFYGFLALRKIGGVAKLISYTSLSAVVLSWLISIGTIGDHRFRIPTMALSLLLQIAGIWSIKRKFSKAL